MPGVEGHPANEAIRHDIQLLLDDVKFLLSECPAPLEGGGHIKSLSNLPICPRIVDRIPQMAPFKDNYLWGVQAYFPGEPSPTIGAPHAFMVPLSVQGSLNIIAKDRCNSRTTLELGGFYYYHFKEKCVLDITGDGRLAALVCAPKPRSAY